MLTKFDAAGNSCCSIVCTVTEGSGGTVTPGAVISNVSSTVHDASFLDTLVEGELSAYCIATTTNEEVLHSTFTLFPNPAEDQLLISATGVISHGVVQLYNMMGEKILEEVFSNESTHEVNVSNIPSGIYLLKLRAKMSGAKENFYSEKLIVR